MSDTAAEHEQPPRTAHKNASRRLVAPTMRDIARATGVSQSTVSRILSRHRHDRADRRGHEGARARERAAELGYRPNPLARGLRGARTMLLGVIVRDITDPFFAAAIEAASHRGQPARLQRRARPCPRARRRGRRAVGHPRGAPLRRDHAVRRPARPAGAHRGPPEHARAGRRALARLACAPASRRSTSTTGAAWTRSSSTSRRSAIAASRSPGGAAWATSASARRRTPPSSTRIGEPHARRVPPGREQRLPGRRRRPRPAHGAAASRRPRSSPRPTSSPSAPCTRPRSAACACPTDLSVTGFDDIPVARVSVPALTTVRMPTREMVESRHRAHHRGARGRPRPQRRPAPGPRAVARRARLDGPGAVVTREPSEPADDGEVLRSASTSGPSPAARSSSTSRRARAREQRLAATPTASSTRTSRHPTTTSASGPTGRSRTPTTTSRRSSARSRPPSRSPASTRPTSSASASTSPPARCSRRPRTAPRSRASPSFVASPMPG